MSWEDVLKAHWMMGFERIYQILRKKMSGGDIRGEDYRFSVIFTTLQKLADEYMAALMKGPNDKLQATANIMRAIMGQAPEFNSPLHVERFMEDNGFLGWIDQEPKDMQDYYRGEISEVLV